MKTEANSRMGFMDLNISMNKLNSNDSFIYLASREVGAYEIPFNFSPFTLSCIQLKSRKFTE